MDLEKELKLNIFSRAKIFIEELKEFAPFGAKFVDNIVIDVVYDTEEEIVDGQKAIDNIINSFLQDVLSGKAEAAAVAFDVQANFKNADGISEKRDALCLKISTDGENWSEEYFPYMVIDGECVWR